MNVRELIEMLQALSEEEKDLPVCLPAMECHAHHVEDAAVGEVFALKPGTNGLVESNWAPTKCLLIASQVLQ